MQQYLLSILGSTAGLLWLSVLFYAFGMLSAFLVKNWKYSKLVGLLSASLASLSLMAAGISALLGLQISKMVIAVVPILGTIGFGVDALSGFFIAFIGFVTLSVSIYSFGYVGEYARRGYSIPRFIFLFNLFLLSIAMVVTAQNAIAFIVFWELMALSSYYLVSFEHKEDSTKSAGLSYLLMTHFGTLCLIVMFIALASGANFSADFSAFSSAQYAPAVAAVIFIFALISFGIKSGVMPFHIWLPVAHPQAPSNISALMSGIMLKTAIYGIVRVVFGFLLGSTIPLWWGLVLLALGMVSSVLGVLYSLMEHDLKTLLAYHSIENIGIIFLGLGAASIFTTINLPLLAAIALFAALYHTMNHALFKSLLFSGAGAVASSAHTRNIDELGGIIKYMPITALLFLVGAASIAALPPLNGFVSEWLTFVALLGGVGGTKLVSFVSGAAILALALTSAFAVAAFSKAFGLTFLGTPRSTHVQKARDPSKAMLFGMGILAAACICAGIFPGVVARMISPVLVQLNMGGAPTIVATVSTLPMLEIFVALLAIVAFTLLYIKYLGKRKHVVEQVGPTWACGLPGINGHMQYSAKGFTMPILRGFNILANPLGRADAYGHMLFEKIIYEPIRKAFLFVAPWSRKLQTGKLVDYLFYLMLTLSVVVAFAVLG